MAVYKMPNVHLTRIIALDFLDFILVRINVPFRLTSLECHSFNK